MNHDPRICRGVRPRDGNSWFNDEGRVYWPGSMAAHCGHWQVNLRCPECGREGRFVENYLGGKAVLCIGKFLRPGRYTLGQYMDALSKETDGAV